MQERVRTIPEALFATAERGEGEYVFYLDDGPVSLPCAELAERAQRAARRLIALGVQPGDPVGVLGPNRPEWVVWAFAIWISGAVLVPVQIPLRVRDPAAFRDQLRSLVAANGCRRVLAEPRLATLLPVELAVGWEEGKEESAEQPVAPAAEDAAVIQLTSGSTAFPKGALLTHAAVLAQMEVLRRGYRFEDGTPRTVLSWTPFFHDLGLFANLVHPAVAGSYTHHLPTERFARDPVEWLRLVERTRVQGTIAPPSAFGSAMRAAKRRDERADLSSLEAAYFAAEGVDPEVARQMLEMAKDFGFRPEALGATYGLAEAVMAVSYPPVGTGLYIERVSASELADTGVAAPAGEDPARLMISCGEPLMDVRIVAPDGVLPERQVGEIQVRGASLMSCYVGADAPDPFVEGWLCTGDLGYLAGGELYVTGRRKDVMIVMGHNYYPEDFEWAAARVDGVRPGRCVAFAMPGEEKAVVLVEASEVGESERLTRDVTRTIVDTVGVPPSDVIVLPPGTVQKTTSGKLRRAAMREAYAAGEIMAVAG
ncbi:MAG: AMP-binding protein [Solirubrobacterales bacterium]